MQRQHFTITTRVGGDDVVLAVAATAEEAVDQFKALGGRVDRQKWVTDTLNGRTLTTDGFPGLRSYSASGQGRFLRVEHHAWPEAMVAGVLAFQREAAAKPQDTTPSRRRERLRS